VNKLSKVTVVLILSSCSWAFTKVLRAEAIAAYEQIGGHEVAPCKLFIHIDPATAEAVSADLANRGLALKTRFKIIKAEVWKFPAEQRVADVLKDVLQIQGVRRASPVKIVYFDADAEPTDDSYYSRQYALPMMDLPEAWEFTAGGDEIIVAVVDTGIQLDHPDLQGNIYVNTVEEQGDDGVDDDQNGYIDDINGWDFLCNDNNPSDFIGHGTQVAGVIGAEVNNAIGIAGVVPNVNILALKVSLDSGKALMDIDSVIEALDYAIDRGAKVVNGSFGDVGNDHDLREAIEQLQAQEILYVASAGNKGKDNDEYYRFPSSDTLANILSVLASDTHDAMCLFSNYGEGSVDLAAAGTGIWTTAKASGYAQGNLTGTSFSAPYVAGIAALLRSKYPDITVRELRLMLMEGTDPAGRLAGKCVTSGRANAYEALTVPVPKTITETNTSSIAIPDDNEVGIVRTVNVTDDVFIRAVSVSVTIQHARMEDLEITIESPSATVCKILEAVTTVYWGDWSGTYTFDTQWTFRGEPSNGDWQLTVKDLTAGNTGTFQSCALEIHTYRDDDEGGKLGGGLLCTNSSGATINNSIFRANTAPAGYGPQIALGSEDLPSTLTISYSDVQGGENDVFVDNDCTLNWEDGNINEDPLFYDSQNGDYHLKSEYGRWDPVSEDWVNDDDPAETSPCIDGGDPLSSFGSEPEPAGFRINMGAYGNTSEASKFKWLLEGDANGDCVVNILDMISIRNRLGEDPSSGDNWRADVTENGFITSST